MQHNEIDHVTEPRAIGQISGDACEQKRAGSQDAIVVSRRAQEIIKHCHCCRDCKHYEEPASEASAFLQLAKSDARIFACK